MSQMTPRTMPENFIEGPAQGVGIIGEVTEALHRFLLDGWKEDTPPPRLEEDLSFVPKDREEVIYIYMYRAAQNTALMNSKQWREAKVSRFGPDRDLVYFERAPLYLELYYLIGIHSKFRSDAERLLGWVLMRLYDATHLVYRPRRYTLPEGKVVDSMGRDWEVGAEGGDELIMEKVGLALVDDLTIGDAINFFTIHEAPFRPYLTYRAQCAMEGPLVAGPPTTVRHHRAEPIAQPRPGHERRNGRLGRMNTRPTRPTNIGPSGHGHRPIEDKSSED